MATKNLMTLLKSPGTKRAALGAGGLLTAVSPTVRDLVFNELLGVDDFKRAKKYAEEGDFTKMLKSLGAGVFELGSTVIPGGGIVKGAKLGKSVLKSAPIGGRVVSAIPGMTRAGMLTPTGRTALNAFRIGEAGQLADAANSALYQFGGPSVNVGSARSAAARAADEAYNKALQQRLLEYMSRGLY